MSQFSQPAAATGAIEWGALNGCLLIIQPAEIVKDINTSFGLTDAVRATVTVIDGPEAGTVREDTLIFPKVLKSQLTSRIGQKVLGRVGQGQAKPGQSPAWILNPGTPADEHKAVTFLTSQLTSADLV